MKVRLARARAFSAEAVRRQPVPLRDAVTSDATCRRMTPPLHPAAPIASAVTGDARARDETMRDKLKEKQLLVGFLKLLQDFPDAAIIAGIVSAYRAG